MPESCDLCGRTYANAEGYDEHSCISTEDAAHAARQSECHEEVSRRGELQPCDLPSVAVRIDSQFNLPYPVCKRHVRGHMVPLVTVAESVEWAATMPVVSPVRGESE